MTEITETPAAQAPEEKKPEDEINAEEATNGNHNGESETNGDAQEESGDKTEPPKEMRAIVLTSFGGFKGLKVLKKPEPTPQAGEVLIRVKACGLNFQDVIVRLGAIDSPPKTPCILGFECAGEIEAVGEGVTNFEVGDRVVALPEFKAWAELVAVSESYVYKIPANMTFTEAAAITLNYLVAHILVNDLAVVRPGNSVLLHSAGGGVGLAVAQLCKLVGDVTLFGVASKAKHETLEPLGLITNLLERNGDYLNEVRKLQPQGVDIVLDCLCGEECNKGYGLLKPMGKYVLYGSANVVTGETKSFFSVARSWWQVDKVSPIKLFDENKSLMGFNLRHLLYQQGDFGATYVRGTVEKVFALWNEGKIKPTVDTTWALEDVADAMQKMHDRKNIGKLILDPAQTPKPKPATPAKGKSKDKKQVIEEKNGDKEKKTDGDAEAEEKKDEEKAEENGTNGDQVADEKSASTNGEDKPSS